MTDNTQPEAGSTHIIRYALEMGLLWIDGSARDKVREALDALDTLEAQLASIGAGGVSALMGAASAGSDGVASLPLPGAQEAVATLALRMLVSADHITQEKADEAMSLAGRFAAPQPALSAGWQPIETAPKDGTPLLLRSKKGRIADGAWITATSSCGGWAWAYVNLEPIEWQPLPVEPSMDGESNELC